MPPTQKIVEIPYRPRRWAQKFHNSFQRFASMILHRRAGKTTCILNHHLRAALDDGWEEARLRTLRPTLTASELRELIKPPGGRHYGHVMPTRVQAKMVAWDKLKHYAQPVGPKPNEAELLIRLPNGNKVQLFGADEPDAMRGPAFSGLSFDEYSQQPANIFSEVLSKALADHLGYAIFAGTIKGKDHLYDTYEAAKTSPEWFSLWQDIDRSLATEEGITIQLLEQAIADDRGLVAKGLMSQEEFDQEWYLSLEAAVKGAYYMEQMTQVRKGGRICEVPHNPDFPVNTAWDLGYDDESVIWFYQNIGNEIHVINYYAESGGTIEEFIEGDMRPGSLTLEILRHPYKYGQHWLPHDARAKTLASGGKTVIEKLGKYLGMGKLAIVPSLSVQDGIQAVRAILGRTWFDAFKCNPGIRALREYKKKYDDKLKTYGKTPQHNWASHPADGFRMLAVAERKEEPPEPQQAKRSSNIYEMTLDQLWDEWDERLRQEVRI